MELKIKVETGKNYCACLWEFGGAKPYNDGLLGVAQIVTGNNGERKNAEYIEIGISAAVGEQALIPITVGDHIVRVLLHIDLCIIELYKIILIDECGVDDRCCTAEKIEENSTEAVILEPALAVALKKANTLHCRKAMYIKE